MNFTLVSRDREVLALCREILAKDSEEHRCNSAASREEANEDADVYLWDIEPGAEPPVLCASPSRHLFLVNRKDLPRFRDQVSAEPSVLLKPVTRATLEVFLAMALAPVSNRPVPATSLRADRDEILQCLIQTNLRLQEYDQDRTTFLARAVHDFRAPLTALSGYCGLLLEEPLGPLNESQKEVLRRMHHSAKRLSRMAGAMFQLSVGRHVKRHPELKRGDIRECLEQALHEVAPFADDKNIAIRVDLAPFDEPLYFESSQIEQVLINILDNACKFTPKAGLIEIRGYPHFWDRRVNRSSVPSAAERRRFQNTNPNTYRIDIQDSGTPIPAEHLEQIFEEYTSYGGGRDRSGGGLGLAITRMIVLQHEGRIWAENTETGPLFSFVLPLAWRELSTEHLEKTA